MDPATETEHDVWPDDITPERARVLSVFHEDCSVLDCLARFAATGCLVGPSMTDQDALLVRNLLGRALDWPPDVSPD